MKQPTISVIIPTLNEEENISDVLKAIPKDVHEIIVVDGNSTDKTVHVAKKFGCTILYDSQGKGSALIKGMNAAKGDIIIMMDADCSNVANEFPLLIGGIEAGYDICMGSRFIQGGGTDDMPWYRKFGNKFFVIVVNLFWKMNYSDLCYGYRSFTKKAVKRLRLSSKSFGIETEMSIHAAKYHLKVVEVPSYEKKRGNGKGKLRTFRHGFQIVTLILKELLCIF